MSVKLEFLDLKGSWWWCCCGELIVILSVHDRLCLWPFLAELKLELRGCHFHSLFCFETQLLILFSLSWDTDIRISLKCWVSFLQFKTHLKIDNNMSFLNCKFHSLSFSIFVLNNYPNKMRKYFYLWNSLKQMSCILLLILTKNYIHTQHKYLCIFFLLSKV